MRRSDEALSARHRSQSIQVDRSSKALHMAQRNYSKVAGIALIQRKHLPKRSLTYIKVGNPRFAVHFSQSRGWLSLPRRTVRIRRRLFQRKDKLIGNLMSTPRLPAYQGPAILSYGFRPFFLLGSIYAGAMIPVWLGIFEGELQLPTAFAPRDWHVHEMLFGYVAAIVGGFLLTAVPNWTGRLPLQGTPLAVLVSSWLAGRIAVCMSAWIGWEIAGAIDAAFLVL